MSYIGNLREAQEYYELLESLTNEMTDSMQASHLMGSFSFFLKKQEYEKCATILDEIKTKKNFNNGAYFKFIKLLFFNLKDNKTIYAYKDDFVGFPYLYSQLMVIKSLESGDVNLANHYWSELSFTYPLNYLNDFNYRGDKNLFSLCLDKYRPFDQIQSNNNEHKSKEDVILEVLLNHKVPIGRDELYRLVWKEDWKNKSELNRLHQLISILRNRGHKIILKNSSYVLDHKSQKIAS